MDLNLQICIVLRLGKYPSTATLRPVAFHYQKAYRTFYDNGNDYYNNLPVIGLNSNLNLLEDFSPLRSAQDPFWWIPQGLYYDLIDGRNDFATTSNPLHPADLVSGFTNQQLFNALDNDINTLPAFRLRLLNENNNSQAANVIALFAFYNY